MGPTITNLTCPRVVAGGQAEKCGLVGQDKVMAINRRAPTSVEEAVHIIKEAGDNLVLVIGRRETREGRNTDKQKGEASNRPQTARGRSRDRKISNGSTRTMSKSPSRQLLQQAMAGARSQKQRSSSSPRSEQPNISPQTQTEQQHRVEEMQQQSKRRVEAENLQEQKRTSIGSSTGKGREEQSQLFSPSAAQLQELLQFAVESAAANDKTKPEGNSVLQTDTQLSGSARGCSNEEKVEKRSCPLPMQLTTVLIEETKETKSSSRRVSTENLAPNQTPGSPATHRASSKKTKTSSMETTTLTKSTTKSTENLTSLGSLGSPKLLRADFQAKCPEVRAAVEAASSRQEVTAKDGLGKNFGSTRSIPSVGKCNCAPFYENKVACLRDSISELGKKNEKQGEENEKLLKENKDIKSAFSFATKQLEEGEERIHKLQNEVLSLSEKLDCEKVKQKATEEKQIQKLEQEISSMKGRLEAEVQRRESAEENYKKSEAELEVKSSQMRQQSEREALRKADYEERLEKALRELRAEYEVKMRESREELARVYKARLKEMQAKAREQKEDKKEKEKEELARRVASLEMASLEVRKKVEQLGDKVEDQKCQAPDEGESKKKELVLQQMHHESLLELRTALDAKIAALEAVVTPQEMNNESSVSEEGEEEEGESQMEKRISQNA